MELKFQKPTTSNFIKTQFGVMDIKDFDKADLEKYILFYSDEIRKNWRKRREVVA